MEYRELRTFKTIIATGSFSKTAANLGYTQSTVSMQIRRLEDATGTKLFNYQNRKVVPTQAAMSLLPMVEKTLTDYADIEHWANSKAKSTTIHVAAPESLTISLISPKIKAFYQLFPHTEVILQNATCRYNEAEILRGTVEIAFMLWPSTPNQRLHDLDLGLQEMMLVSSQANLNLSDLINAPAATFYINEPECSYRNQFETALWQQHQKKFRTVTLPSIGAIKAAVINDLGFSYLPKRMVQLELDQHKLYSVDNDVNNQIHAHLLTRKDAHQSEMVQKFVHLFS